MTMSSVNYSRKHWKQTTCACFFKQTGFSHETQQYFVWTLSFLFFAETWTLQTEQLMERPVILRAPPLSIISGPERGRLRLNVKFSDDVSVITDFGAEKNSCAVWRIFLLHVLNRLRLSNSLIEGIILTF